MQTRTSAHGHCHCTLPSVCASRTFQARVLCSFTSIASLRCCYVLSAAAPLKLPDVLEWAWFLNSFSEKHIYDFMYGDKDTFGVAFGLAGKAHMYQHINVPPGEGRYVTCSRKSTKASAAPPNSGSKSNTTPALDRSAFLSACALRFCCVANGT